jgi:hypothetical protein
MNSNISTTYRRFLHLKAITKYGIFGLALISLIYCILTWLGFYVPWMFIAFFTFAFVLRFILSKAFGLCWIHRTCILYNYGVSLIIVTKPETLYNMVSIEKQSMVGVMAIIGLIIFSLVLWKIQTKKSC